MSHSGTLQRRTTYLISLTLVKVEAVGADDGTEPTKPLAPTTAPALPQSLDHEANTREEEKVEDISTTPENEKERGISEPQEQKVEFREWRPNNEAKPENKTVYEVRPPPPKAKGISCPLVLSNYKDREAPREEKSSTRISDDEEKKVDRTRTGPSKHDVYKTEFYTPTPEKASDVGVSNGASVRSSLPVRLSQRPEALLRAAVTMNRRELKEASKNMSSSAKSLDCQVREHSPPVTITMTMGPYRASWSESEGRGMYQRIGIEPLMVAKEGYAGPGLVALDSPQVEKFRTISTSLPAPAARPPMKPQRKGKSRTLDNSDLHLLSEDLKKGKETQVGASAGQRASTSGKDRKMLKFISGIFTKSTQCPATPAVPATPIPLHRPMQRGSSEEEAASAASQEWILSHTIQELHLGILGSLHSGKSSLLHRYMTGSYLPFESPEGGMFKKEVLIDGQSHVLIIREEPGLPDAQFCCWVDGVILVFSLENESSFLEVYNIYRQLGSHCNIAELPFIVVGTQDKITSTNPRVIDDARARQLCSDVHRCTYYETCATYGLNVNRVFSEAAQKIVTMKRQLALYASCKSLPNSPSHSGGSTPVSGAFLAQASNGGQSSDYSSLPSTPVISHKDISMGSGGETLGTATPISLRSGYGHASRFTVRRGSDSDRKSVDSKDFGLIIPIKQSILLKRSGNSLKQEWKKKYVTLSNNGMLSYHSSVSDYMQNVHGKELDLLHVTVKVPGKRPPRAGPLPGLNGVGQDRAGPEGTNLVAAFPSSLLTVEERAGVLSPLRGQMDVQQSPFSHSSKVQSTESEGIQGHSLIKHPNASPVTDRKKHRRKKSMNQRGDTVAGPAEAKRKMWKLKSFGSLRNINKTDDENCEFQIVSSTGQTWHFEAQSPEERDAWVQGIESQILASLQSCESSKNKARRHSQSEAFAIQAIRNAKGNRFCVDCDAPNPTWASLNLGALICIECSGIHRNLGTHLSRVRSLDLDDWSCELTLVLIAIGNDMANSIWESRTKGRHKPHPDATREERESWIRAKYEQKLFVAPLSALNDGSDDSLSVRLYKAVMERDLPKLLFLLAHSSKEEINAPSYMMRYGNGAVHESPSALHAACQLGDVVMTQLLIWYGSDVRSRDCLGQTALALAQRAGSQVCADILLQYGCPSEISPITSTSPITSPSGATSPSLSRNSSCASLSRSSSKRPLS